jgi:hypothetical protein
MAIVAMKSRMIIGQFAGCYPPSMDSAAPPAGAPVVRFRTSIVSNIKVATHMQEIRVEANHFSDCPPASAIQPAVERHVKAARNSEHEIIAPHRAHENPRPNNNPQASDSPPHMPPEISAVFAAGLKPSWPLFGSYITARTPTPIRNRP